MTRRHPKIWLVEALPLPLALQLGLGYLLWLALLWILPLFRWLGRRTLSKDAGELARGDLVAPVVFAIALHRLRRFIEEAKLSRCEGWALG